MNEINLFPQEVIENIGYYVYKLIDPRNGEVFYIGKGKGNRVFNHAKGALQVAQGNIEEQEDDLDLKTKRITQIIKARFKVIHVIHRHGMDESTAFEVEAALIDDYQGLTGVQGGVGSNDFGPMHVQEIIEKYSTEEADFGDNKVVMITVNRTSEFLNLYAATRFAWRMNINRARQADIVCAVVRGVIKAVFIPSRWDYATIKNFPEIPFEEQKRVGFEGTIADEEFGKLIGKKVSTYQKKGASNPVKYNY